MTRFPSLAGAVALTLTIHLGGLTPPAQLLAQLPPEKALAAMKPAAGFQVELFAAEPMLLNPTSIDIDHKGRVWVAEAVNYRRVGFNRPLIRPEGDRIVVLVDEKGDGKATKAVTFYQGKDLYGPIGICVAPIPASGRRQPAGANDQPADAGRSPCRVFVCQSPDILLFEDKDGDLKADGPPKKFLSGFRGFDHDHGVHGINIGPDGKLYFTVGDAGVQNLQSADGKGRKFTSNSTDVRAGTVWRCDQDGTNLELLAHNFRNNYECCVDSFGEVWLSDNDDDGNQQTRICFVMPGGNYGYHPRGAGQTHWHEEQPGVVHKTLRTGFGSPTGITFYEGTLFPEKYRGQLLHCDAGPREVRAFFRKPKGAGYELDKEVILTSTDNWFRPSDVCVAPDGSIFVADWYDRGVGGHGMGDPSDGRIYRLTPKGHKGYKVPEVKLDTKDGVLAALGSPCLATRALAIRHTRGERKIEDMTALQLLVRWSNDPAVPLTTRARSVLLGLGRYQFNSLNPIPPRYFGNGLQQPPFDTIPLRAPTARGKEGMMLLLNWAGLRPNWSKQSVAARREVLLFLRDQDEAIAKIYFYELAKLYDGHDIFYRAALNIACGTDPKRRDAILADFDKHFPEWNDKVADLVWELRPKSVISKLDQRFADPKVSVTQQRRVFEIIASSDAPDTAEKVLGIYTNPGVAQVVREMAFEAMRDNLPGRWAPLAKTLKFRAVLQAGLHGDAPHPLPDGSTPVHAIELAAATKDFTHRKLIRELAANAAERPRVRSAAVRALGKFGEPADVKVLVAVANEKYDRERGSEWLFQKLAIQVLGGMQGKEALAALQPLVLDAKLPADLRTEAVAALASTRGGTGLLLKLKQDGQLPKELEAHAGRLLRNSPFQGERNKALLLFPAPGKLDPKKLPALAVLAKRSGDPARGKQVWDASLNGAAQCAKCHTVRGSGGQVGPDLSMIGKKASKENLYESILDPSKAIADQYLQHQVTTVADVTVTGLLVSDTPQAVTLRDANGKDTVIPRKDIEGEPRKLKVSIMPQDIVAGLTEDELIDLVAYLGTLQTAAFTPDSFRIVGPFPAKDMLAALNRECGPETKPFDPKQTFNGAAPGDTIMRPIVWGKVRPDAKGYFDLAALIGDNAANSASYMYAEFDSPSDQDAEVLLGSDDGAKLWVNGKEVFKTAQTRAAAPGQERVPVKLVKGKNAVLLKVANGNNPHGFYFTLLSKDEVKPVK